MKDAKTTTEKRKQSVLGIVLASTLLITAAVIITRLIPKPDAREVANSAITSLKNQNADGYVNLASEEQLKRVGVSKEQLKKAFQMLSKNVNITRSTPTECETYDDQITQCRYSASYEGVPIEISINVAKVNDDFRVVNSLAALLSPQLMVAKVNSRGQSKKQSLIALRNWAQDSKQRLAPLGIQNFESGSEISNFDHYIQSMDSAIAKWEEQEKK